MRNAVHLVEEEIDPIANDIRDSILRFISDPHYAEAYAAQVRNIVQQTSMTLLVNWDDYTAFHKDASDVVSSNLLRAQPHLNAGLHQYIRQSFPTAEHRKRYTVTFSNVPSSLTVRGLRASLVGQLLALRGTITRSSQVRPELLVGVFRCNDCGSLSKPIQQQFRYTEPPSCRNEDCQNRLYWTLDAENPSTLFGDWQKLRLQEGSSEIPVGSMPRTMEIIVRDDAVETAKPGDRLVFTGCPIVVPDVSKLFARSERREVQQALSAQRRAVMEDAQLQSVEGATGLRALGVRDLGYRLCFLAGAAFELDGVTSLAQDMSSAKATNKASAAHIHPQQSHPELWERAVEIKTSFRSSGIHGLLSSHICPSIFKHELVKLGILLQLAGGVPKKTREGIHLRGDINVCIVGDPSTAKSQLLKWISAHAPRAVYTSGKGSTGSGLTATVMRDADTGERTIEAGALMLADRGVCCIDEFDRMDVKDQVAIHEAMEQQTISIAKAGIKATLNARTSILAALCPIGGRYDRRKPLQKNIALTAPILSRFDLLFCVVDDGGVASDRDLAKKVLMMHRNSLRQQRPDGSSISTEKLLLYLKCARLLQPRLGPEAQSAIPAAYRKFRVQDSLGNRNRVFRVTTRLLESIIRLSEAAAKLDLVEVVAPSHVDLAIDLLWTSMTAMDMSDIEFEVDSQEKSKTKRTLSRELYDRLANQLIAGLSQHESITTDALLKWWTEATEHGSRLPSEQHTAEEWNELVRLVLERMVQEGTVLALEDGTRMMLDPNRSLT